LRARSSKITSGGTKELSLLLAQTLVARHMKTERRYQILSKILIIVDDRKSGFMVLCTSDEIDIYFHYGCI
jgi:hypothetical protein